MTQKIYFYCPECLLGLIFRKNEAKCINCGRKFENKEGIFVLLPSFLSENKIKEDWVHTLKGQDNSWYNHRIWYYFIHLSSHVLRFEQEFLPKIGGKRVLELACGNGWASLLVKRKNPNVEVYASDISFHCLNIQGRQMSEIMRVRPDYFVVCDAEKLPFKDNFFDTVFVFASLHHFPNIEKALLEVKRVLKPGGSFLAVDGMMPKIAQRLLGDESSERTRIYGILERRLTFSDWLNFLKKAGMPKDALHLNYDPTYLHSYPTNPDEQKLIKKNWVFNVAKEIIYGAFLSKMSQKLVEFLGLTYIFPAGIVINYQKPKK
ncbi:MAG: class I SAM-dependent methyltransferase [Patescibacteria group bacterium]